MLSILRVLAIQPLLHLRLRVFVLSQLLLMAILMYTGDATVAAGVHVTLSTVSITNSDADATTFDRSAELKTTSGNVDSSSSNDDDVVLSSILSWPIVRPQDYGAVADGVHNDTAALQLSIAHCTSLISGCDLVLANGTFLSGPLTLPPRSRLRIDSTGVLRAAPMQMWKQAGWQTGGFLTADALHNVSIAGPGTIDGNGEAWWNVTHDDLHYRPHMIVLHNLTGVVVDGVQLLNSPNHNLVLEDCHNVRVRNLKVHAPASSPNTDGVNFAGGSDQSIVDSHISNGDDCVSIVCTEEAGQQAGSAQKGGNVVVSNITCVNGHGVSIGSIRHGIVKNVTVENVAFWDSEHGPRIKAYPNNSGLVSGIVYRNISLHRVKSGLLIDAAYCPVSQRPWPCPPGNKAVLITDILFEDIHGDVHTSTLLDGTVGTFRCSAITPCTNITLRDVNLTCSNDKNDRNNNVGPSLPCAPKFSCSHISGSAVGNVEPPSCFKSKTGSTRAHRARDGNSTSASSSTPPTAADGATVIAASTLNAADADTANAAPEATPPSRPWVWRSNWSWDRLQVLTWGTNSTCCPYNGTNAHCCSIYENTTELAHKSAFDVIFQDNDLGMVGCRVPMQLPNGTFVPQPGAGGMDTLETCKRARSNAAARIKRVAPSKAVLDYRGIVIAWWNYQTPAHDSWWLRGDIPGSVRRVGVLDWRVPEVGDYFYSRVFGADTFGNTHLDGVFVDTGFNVALSPNLTYASRRALQLAQLDIFRRICTTMAAHGKVVAVSLKTHFGALSDQQGMRICPADIAPHNTTPCMPFGEEKVFEILGPTRGFVPHRQFNIPSRDFGDAAHGGSNEVGCVTAVLNLQRGAQLGPVLVTNNDGGLGSGVGKNGEKVDWYKAHNVSLAAFLLAMETQSYFGSGMHWTDAGWNTPWHMYSRPLGRPRGPAVRTGSSSFRRDFEHVMVELDCAGNISAVIDWR